MSVRSRAARAAVVLALALTFAGCGGDDSSSEPDSADAPASATAAEDSRVLYREGTITSVTANELLLQTAEGEERYMIDQSVAPVLGLDHIASHAGAGIGFRIFYSERQGERYLVRGEETGAAP